MGEQPKEEQKEEPSPVESGDETKNEPNDATVTVEDPKETEEVKDENEPNAQIGGIVELVDAHVDGLSNDQKTVLETKLKSIQNNEKGEEEEEKEEGLERSEESNRSMTNNPTISDAKNDAQEEFARKSEEKALQILGEKETSVSSAQGHIEGYLKKWPMGKGSLRIGSGEKRRYVIINNGELKYYENQDGKELGAILITSTALVEGNDATPSMFSLTVDGNVMKFQTFESD